MALQRVGDLNFSLVGGDFVSEVLSLQLLFDQRWGEGGIFKF